MPQDVVDRVHTLARRAAANVALTFADRHGDIIPNEDDDDDNDADYIPNADDDTDEVDYPFDEDDDDAPDADPGHIAGVEGYYPPNITQPHPAIVTQPDPAIAAGFAADRPIADDEDATATDAHNDDNDPVEPEPNNEDDAVIDRNEAAVENELIDVMAEDIPDDENVEAEMNQQYGERTAAYNLRPRKPRDYGHMHATLEHTVMTQLNMNKGIKEFGDAGVDAVLNELQQLHDRNVLEPMNANELTREEKRAALHYLTWLRRR